MIGEDEKDFELCLALVAVFQITERGPLFFRNDARDLYLLRPLALINLQDLLASDALDWVFLIHNEHQRVLCDWTQFNRDALLFGSCDLILRRRSGCEVQVALALDKVRVSVMCGGADRQQAVDHYCQPLMANTVGLRHYPRCSQRKLHLLPRRIVFVFIEENDLLEIVDASDIVECQPWFDHTAIKRSTGAAVNPTKLLQR